jgi:hypothetical protein
MENVSEVSGFNIIQLIDAKRRQVIIVANFREFAPCL